LPAANKPKKSSSKSSLLAANGGGSACSVLSKHAAKYVKSLLVSSLPATKGGQSAGDTMTVSIVSPIQSQSNTIKSDLVNLKCVADNCLSQDATLKEVHKYVKYDVDVPLTQEDLLKMLMEKFSLAELNSAYFLTMGKVGLEDPSEIMLPINACNKTAISLFISLIYDHRCMMYDYAVNTFR
jgi:hypothetical protein